MFKKKGFLFGTIALTLASAVFPTAVGAMDYYEEPSQIEVQEKVDDRQEKLSQYIEEYMKNDIEGDSGTVEITDSELTIALDKAGYDIPDAMLFANGVTKVNVHSLKNGNIDVYLSKTFINNTIAGGAGALGGALAALLPGAGWGAAIGAISGIIGTQQVENGKVFTIRNFQYTGSRNQ